jgi:hypothetical protein
MFITTITITIIIIIIIIILAIIITTIITILHHHHHCHKIIVRSMKRGAKGVTVVEVANLLIIVVSDPLLNAHG